MSGVESVPLLRRGPNLVLIGYRGSGKSTMARRLSKLLDIPKRSTDELLEKRFRMTIEKWVAKHGWDAFRDEEEKVVAECCQMSSSIIDCGGGVVERSANGDRLRAAGLVIWLTADPKVLARRIRLGSGRPSLTGKASASDEVMAVLERRTPLYRAFAHHEVSTSGGALRTAPRIIVDHYERAWKKAEAHHGG